MNFSTLLAIGYSQDLLEESASWSPTAGDSAAGNGGSKAQQDGAATLRRALLAEQARAAELQVQVPLNVAKFCATPNSRTELCGVAKGCWCRGTEGATTASKSWLLLKFRCRPKAEALLLLC